MNFITGLLSAGARAAGAGFRHPMAAGAAIGAGVGFFGSDGSITQRLGTAAETAALGAGVGALMPFSGAGLYSKVMKGKGSIKKAALNISKRGVGLGISAIENAVPLLTIGAGLYGASQVLDSQSPTLEGASVRTDYNQQAMQADEMNSMFFNTPGVMGSAPQYRQQMQRFQNSTMGLVQGLHASRH